MSLLAPAFLFGLLAIGVPIWLHRLSSENPNRQPFSSVMFLEPGEPRRVIAKQLRYFLLFALRVGVLSLLTLVFAGVVLEGSLQNILSETARLHVIVMDRSASMAHGNRWERAQAMADTIVDGLDDSDVVQVVAADRIIEVLVEPSLDRAPIRQAINAAEPTPFRVDYGQLMSSMDSLLRGAELPVVLHILTDTQQSSLPTRFADLAPRTSLELTVHNVSVSGEENWALDGLVWSALSGDLTANLRSYSEQDVERTVTLLLNGTEIAVENISIEAGQTAQVNFMDVELSAGANQVVAKLNPSDELSLDNERYLVVKQPIPRPILLVSSNNRDDASFFLTSALETLATQTYEIQRIFPTELANHSFENYVFVVIADAGALAENDSEVLSDFVESGGAVFMALSQRSAGLNFVPITGHSLSSFSQFRAEQGGFLAVGNMDSSHLVLRQLEGLRTAKFYRHIPVDIEPIDTVLMRLEDGSPLLIEHPKGQGRVMIFTSSLDREWNDLPLQPVFVPFMAQLSSYMAGDDRISIDAQLGSTLSSRAMGFSGGQIFAPDGERALGLAGAGAGDEVIVDQIGFYEVLASGQTEFVAVNIDAQESDVTPMPANGFIRWNELGSTPVETAEGGIAMIDDASTDLWPWILSLLLIVVIVESWVGNWHLRVRRGIAA
jgi:hypothetical protein